MNLKNGFYVTLALAGLMLLPSCDHTKNNPGWQYFDDMVHSPAYETYTSNPNFADGKTLRNPVEGTIPRGFEPYPFQKNDEDRVTAGKTLVNPFPATEANLARGKQVFTVYCSRCHGDLGDGKGYLYTSGKYPYPPASLLTDKVRNNPEGEIYHVISVGWGIMAAHGSMIRPDDRWKAVLYVRNVLQKGNADQAKN
jgi:mono/diheme cytochrome c family protein